jgi:hypothetical protein
LPQYLLDDVPFLKLSDTKLVKSMIYILVRGLRPTDRVYGRYYEDTIINEFGPQTNKRYLKLVGTSTEIRMNMMPQYYRRYSSIFTGKNGVPDEENFYLRVMSDAEIVDNYHYPDDTVLFTYQFWDNIQVYDHYNKTIWKTFSEIGGLFLFFNMIKLALNPLYCKLFEIETEKAI